jgi:hypothetical protein
VRNGPYLKGKNDVERCRPFHETSENGNSKNLQKGISLKVRTAHTVRLEASLVEGFCVCLEKDPFFGGGCR